MPKSKEDFFNIGCRFIFNIRPCFCEIQFTALSNMYKIRKRSLKDKMEYQDEEQEVAYKIFFSNYFARFLRDTFQNKWFFLIPK